MGTKNGTDTDKRNSTLEKIIKKSNIKMQNDKAKYKT